MITNFMEGNLIDKLTELSASEAVWGFAAWLTTRHEALTMSRYHSASVVVELVAEFCKVNGLPEPRDHWEENLTHPPDGGPLAALEASEWPVR